MNESKKIISIGELRGLLFSVKSQNMTVKKLRGKLFDENDQDGDVTEKLLNQY